MQRVSLISAVALALAGCIDTTVPDLTEQIGTGVTDAAQCTSSDLTEFPPETLQMHVIDVGQGDAIWIRTPYYSDADLESLDVLIDTGNPGGGDAGPGGEIVSDYLMRFGHNEGEALDALVITHGHTDHYGGMDTILSRFPILRYVDPGYAPSPYFESRRQQANDAIEDSGGSFDAPAVPGLSSDLYSGIDLFGGYVDARILWGLSQHPTGSTTTEPAGTDINNTSVVLSVSWSDRRILLMGDAEEYVESQLVAAAEAGEIDLRADVLKVGHHGSNNSSTPAFLQATLGTDKAPTTWAVISSGRRSYKGTQLPHPIALSRLSTHLAEFHLLSTENGDEEVPYGEEHNDDHILVTIGPSGEVRACYVP